MKHLERKTPAHLVLSGGGVLCLAYAGALSALHGHGIEFKSVSACSAGTFIGALLCAGLTPQRIEQALERVPPPALLGEPALPGFLSYLAMLRWPFARYRQPGFPAVFREILGEGRDPTFAELHIPFSTAGIDIAFNRFLVYASETHPTMRVSEALAVAVSVPIAYPPYEPEGRIVLDAGIASECPIWLAADHDDEFPIIALRPAKSVRFEHPKSLIDYIAQAFGSAIRSRDDYLIRQMPRVRLIEIDCGKMRSDRFDLSPPQVRTLIAAGRKAAEDGLRQFGDDLRNVSEVPKPAPPGESQHEIAVARGNHLMARFNQDLSQQVRNRVFISYSHADRDWLERVQIHLKPHFRNSPLVVWSDKGIRPGQGWAEEIDQALDASKVAVLLVSPNYLASDFIMKEEMPCILSARDRKRLKVLWVHLSHSAWEESPLQPIQAAHAVEQPLDSLQASDVNRVLVAIGQQVKAAAEAP